MSPLLQTLVLCIAFVGTFAAEDCVKLTYSADLVYNTRRLVCKLNPSCGGYEPTTFTPNQAEIYEERYGKSELLASCSKGSNTVLSTRGSAVVNDVIANYQWNSKLSFGLVLKGGDDDVRYRCVIRGREEYQEKVFETTYSVTSKPVYTTQEPKYPTEKPVYTTRGAQYPTEKPVYTTRGPQYPTEKPVYTTRGPQYPTEKPVYTTRGPQYPTEKPVYTTRGPQYPTEKPVYTTRGPQYPTEKPVYTTRGPQYPTEKPVYTTREAEYPTEKPVYTTQGPQYPTERPVYTPQEPEYQTGRPVYTPREPEYSTGRPVYTPREPEYSTGRPVYTPREPEYLTGRPVYTPREPEYSTEMPVYTPREPEYSTGRPVYTPREPEYSTGRPVYTPRPPEYSTGRPVYTPRQPEYSTEEPVYTTRGKVYTSVKPVYTTRNMNYVTDTKDINQCVSVSTNIQQSNHITINCNVNICSDLTKGKLVSLKLTKTSSGTETPVAKIDKSQGYPVPLEIKDPAKNFKVSGKLSDGEAGYLRSEWDNFDSYDSGIYKCSLTYINGQGEFITVSESKNVSKDYIDDLVSELYDSMSTVPDNSGKHYTTDKPYGQEGDECNEDLKTYKENVINYFFYEPAIFGNKKYHLSKEPFTNDVKSDDLCRVIVGGYLAEMDNAQEYDAVAKYLREHEVRGALTGGTNVDDVGVWKFRRTGKAVPYFRWRKGEPSNTDGKEHCLAIWTYFSDLMNDTQCNGSGFKYHFVCETDM